MVGTGQEMLASFRMVGTGWDVMASFRMVAAGQHMVASSYFSATLRTISSGKMAEFIGTRKLPRLHNLDACSTQWHRYCCSCLDKELLFSSHYDLYSFVYNTRVTGSQWLCGFSPIVNVPEEATQCPIMIALHRWPVALL